MIRWPFKRKASTCIVWATHVEDSKILASFDRLYREAGEQYATFGVYNSGIQASPSSDERIRTVCHDDLLKALPSRSEGVLESGDIRAGFADALHFAAFASVPRHDYYWFVEYDVDFSGNWLSLFDEFRDNSSDLIATTLYPRSADPAWAHWESFGAPSFLTSEQSIRGFFPIYRASRKFIETYRSHVGNGWQGHFEALFASIAAKNGLTIEDIGGTGPFTPANRRWKFYNNHHLDRDLSPGTFRFRPAVSDSYFSKGHPDFADENRLWHPVKTGIEQTRRIRHAYELIDDT